MHSPEYINNIYFSTRHGAERVYYVLTDCIDYDIFANYDLQAFKG